MNQQSIDGSFQGLFQVIRVPQCRVHGNDHIPQHDRFESGLARFPGVIIPHGKRQDIRRACLAPISQVQLRHASIIRKQNAQLFFMTFQVF